MRTTGGTNSILKAVFFLSGFASLIYQVVWQRLLTTYYGVGSISTAIIVSVFMAGLGLGALMGGFLAERLRNRIAFYFLVELLIGMFGLSSLSLLDELGRRTAAADYPVMLAYMFLFLCVPTLLMGITLPLLVKIFSSSGQDFGRTVSLLYFINTLGAALGCVAAGYVIISFFGLDTAVYTAAAINFALAALILHAARVPAATDGPKPAPAEPADTAGSPAAGGELGRIAYIGIAAGSCLMNRRLKKRPAADRRNLFFSIQFLTGLCVALLFIGYYYLTKYTPFDFFSVTSFFAQNHPPSELFGIFSSEKFPAALFILTDFIFWPVLFVFAPTVLMGAGFPLLPHLARRPGAGEGATTGNVYFFNIAGNMLGGLATGFLILPFIGTERTVLAFSLTGMLFGLFISKPGHSKKTAFITSALLVLNVCLIVLAVFPGQKRLYELIHPGSKSSAVYFEEGLESVVFTTVDNETGQVQNYINGLLQGDRPGNFYRIETIEALTYAPGVKDILIIGYGAGAVTSQVLSLKETGNVTVVEISAALMKNFMKIPFIRKELTDPRVTIITDDGRRYLMRTGRKFDLILMDPLRNTTSYSNNLHSREYFRLAASRMKPGGVILSNLSEHRVMPHTIAASLPYVRMYDYFCLASNSPLEPDTDRWKTIVTGFSPHDFRLYFTLKQKAGYIGDRAFIKKNFGLWPIDRDRKPVSEFYMGLSARNKSLEKRANLLSSRK